MTWKVFFLKCKNIRKVVGTEKKIVSIKCIAHLKIGLCRCICLVGPERRGLVGDQSREVPFFRSPVSEVPSPLPLEHALECYCALQQYEFFHVESSPAYGVRLLMLESIFVVVFILRTICALV